MSNSNLNMQSLQDDKTIALNLKDIEQDTMAMDEDDKNDSKDDKKEDGKKPRVRFLEETTCKSINKELFVQVLVVSVLNMAQLNIGLGLGFSSISIPDLEKVESEIHANKIEISWFVAILCIGQVVGALLSAIMASYFGRKCAVLSSCPFGLMGWILQGAGKNLEALMAGRFFVGMSLGMEGSIHCMYVCELSSKKYRGPLAASSVVILNLGFLLMYILGSSIHWQTAALVSSTIPFLTFIGVLFIPESPSWLVRKKQNFHGARKAILKLNRDTLSFAEEFEEDVKKNILESMDTLALPTKEISRIGEFYSKNTGRQVLQSGSAILEKLNYQSISKQSHEMLEEIFSRKTMIPLLILSTLFFVQSWSGAIVVFFFGVSIFQEAGITLNAYYATIIIGVIQVFGSSLGAAIINKTGRKLLLMISLAVCSVCMAGLGACYYIIESYGKEEAEIASWMALVCLILNTLSFMAGLAPVPWVLVGELLPAQNRSIITAVATSICYISIFLVSFTFPFLSDESAFNVYGAFWFYAGICILGLLFTIFVVPNEYESDGNASYYQRGSAEFDNVILEFSGEEKAGVKEITKRVEDIVEPFNERSIYSIDHVSTNPLSKAHDNFAYEHTSFDPQVGGVLFQGSNLSSTVSSRYLERSNEVLDYIDCISNEDVPYEIPVTNSKEKDCVITKENEVSSDTRRSFDDGKEKDGKTSIKDSSAEKKSIDPSSMRKEPKMFQVAKLLIKENIRQKAKNESNTGSNGDSK